MTPDKIMFIDLETQNKPYFGAVASPRHPDNYVVMRGTAIESVPYQGEIVGATYYNKEQAANWLSIPDDVWLVVAHNAPYELDWAIHQQRDELMKFLKRGGRVFCTAYAHYLLSNQQETYPPLDTVAPQYGGSHKVDGISILWKQGILTEDIDKQLLGEYLLGPEGDIENTRKVFYGEWAKLTERGMIGMALERMEGMLFNCFAMASGMHINRALAFHTMEEHNRELDALVNRFREYRAQFPSDVVFKETSDFHMSAWLYGGPVKYRARVPALDAEGKEQYEKLDCYKFGDRMVRVEHATDPAVFELCVREYGSCDRFQRGKQAGQPKVHKVADVTTIKTKWGELLFQCPPLVDLDLLPKDIRKAFDETHTGKRFLADETPVYSTGAEALEFLSKRKEFTPQVQDILRSLLKFARLDKDIGTYYLREEKDDDGNVVKRSGMLQYMTENDIVHHSLNTTSTVTGRLSSNRPNFQNLPRGDDNELHTSKVKEMFTSRYGDEGCIIEADYTALEVVTLAAFSQDEALMKALVSGTDMHCLRLSKKLNQTYEHVLSIVKDQTHPEHSRYKQMRTDIKPPSFAYQYGATAMGISFSTGMDLQEAEEFIANEKALFPGVEAWYNEEVIPTVERDTTRHREQMEDGSWRMYQVGTWTSPAGTRYAFRQYAKTRWENGQKVTYMEFKPTQIRNYPVQGESGFFVQAISGLIIRWLIANEFFGGKVHVINTVHDAFYLDCHKSVLPIVASTVKQIMESLPTYLSEKFGYNLNVPFPAEVEYGPNMKQKTKFKPEDFA